MNVLIIDIETTGLDPDKHQILEIYAGLCYPNQSGQIDREFYQVLDYSNCNLNLSYGAFSINEALIKKCWNGDGIFPESVRGLLGGFLSRLPRPLVLAGKNVAGFDRPFLEKFLGCKIEASHRVLDPAMLYLRWHDIVPPSLEECMRRAGFEVDKSRLHNAKYDSECVLKLLRHKMKDL